MAVRHLVWFRVDEGHWLGEWMGEVPVPQVPPSMIGDARMMVMNEWLQQTQRLITPMGSPYDVREQCWDQHAWDDCPAGGAVCVDVTKFNWPVGDQYFHQWNTLDGGIEYPDMRHYIQLDRASKHIDANQSSSRFIRPTEQKALLDITGTALDPFHGSLHGQLTHENGRWLLTGAPAHVSDGIQHALDAGSVDIHAALVPQKALTA